jgi:predicted transposase YbfD/YdcC
MRQQQPALSRNGRPLRGPSIGRFRCHHQTRWRCRCQPAPRRSETGRIRLRSGNGVGSFIASSCLIQACVNIGATTAAISGGSAMPFPTPGPHITNAPTKSIYCRRRQPPARSRSAAWAAGTRTRDLAEDHNQPHAKACRLRLTAAEAGPESLLEQSRNHWAIGNRLHYVRDVTFNEDHCRVRSGPRARAAIRNLVPHLIRAHGTPCQRKLLRRSRSAPRPRHRQDSLNGPAKGTGQVDCPIPSEHKIRITAQYCPARRRRLRADSRADHSGGFRRRPHEQFHLLAGR